MTFRSVDCPGETSPADREASSSSLISENLPAIISPPARESAWRIRPSNGSRDKLNDLTGNELILWTGCCYWPSGANRSSAVWCDKEILPAVTLGKITYAGRRPNFHRDRLGRDPAVPAQARVNWFAVTAFRPFEHWTKPARLARLGTPRMTIVALIPLRRPKAATRVRLVARWAGTDGRRQAFLIAEISNSRTTLSLTRTPPVSSAAFQVMP